MRLIRSGITRNVILTRHWAIKVPNSYAWGVRGWLANRSEWRQRRRPDVNPPVFTLAYVVSVYRRAVTFTAFRETDPGPWQTHQGDEAKPSSWGCPPASSWRLIDYDRAWAQEDRGWIGALYFGRQERLARRWMNL